jgi:hypothetical protein
MEHETYYHMSIRNRKLHLIRLILSRMATHVIFALLLGWLVMILWNWLMPFLFGLKTITYWMGFGLLLFAKLLGGSAHCSYDNRNPGRYSLKDRVMGGWMYNGEHEYWKFYREYWKERGKKDFEQYLQEHGYGKI